MARSALDGLATFWTPFRHVGEAGEGSWQALPNKRPCSFFKDVVSIENKRPPLPGTGSIQRNLPIVIVTHLNKRPVTSSSPKPNLFIDRSQCVGRVSWKGARQGKGQGILSCICKTSCHYSYALDRDLDGYDYLAALGYPNCTFSASSLTSRQVCILSKICSRRPCIET